MRNKPIYFVLTVFVTLTVLFVTRQKTLNDLRSANAAARLQIESRKTGNGAAVQEPPANNSPPLSAADEKELLQLRSKLLPLREQLRNASNRVVFLHPRLRRD